MMVSNNGRRLRVAVSGLYHETNTFAPGKTTLADFQQEWMKGKEAFYSRYEGTRTSMGGVIDAAQQENVELVPGLYTYATPGGMVEEDAVDKFLSELEQSLDPELDGLILILHGAMVSEKRYDVEGDVLQFIRGKRGIDFPIAVTLDLHANISPEMVNNANIIVGYDTYPHIDAYERAVDAVHILACTLRGEHHPVMAWCSAKILAVPQQMVTHEMPMMELMQAAAGMEKDKRVLKVVVIGGFPYSDVPFVGMSFIVVTDNDPALAESCANKLAELAWSRKGSFQSKPLSGKEAVRIALTEPTGPVILAEGSDNVGGGAPADGTHLLQELKAAPCRSLIVIRDREEAVKAFTLGEGAAFEGWVGGKSDNLHGNPYWLEGTIMKISVGSYQHFGPYMAGQWAYMGKTAVVESHLLTVILTEERVPPWDIGHLVSLGLDPADYHIIVAKSAIAWRTAFGTIAKRSIDVDTPGCCSADLSHFDYKHVLRPLFPLDPI